MTSEAVLHRIPVLCSTSGGLAEAMAGCGVVLEAPQHCREDFFSLPTDEEIKPWVEGLKTILQTDYSEQFDRAAKLLSRERTTQRVLEAFLPLLVTRGTDHPLYYTK